MPQEFQVLQCFSCQTFQVHQVKKSNKWSCKLCGEKQSIKKVFGHGTGAECRVHVQKLNTHRGELDNFAPASNPHTGSSVSLTGGLAAYGDYDAIRDEGEAVKESVNANETTAFTSQTSRWGQFVEESAADEPGDDNDNGENHIATSYSAVSSGRGKQGANKRTGNSVTRGNEKRRKSTDQHRDDRWEEHNDKHENNQQTEKYGKKSRNGEPFANRDYGNMASESLSTLPSDEKLKETRGIELPRGRQNLSGCNIPRNLEPASKWDLYEDVIETIDFTEDKVNDYDKIVGPPSKSNISQNERPSKSNISQNQPGKQSKYAELHAPQNSSEWSTESSQSEPSQAESDCISERGDNLSGILNTRPGIQDMRPYVSFDDLQTCGLDVDSCLTRQVQLPGNHFPHRASIPGTEFSKVTQGNEQNRTSSSNVQSCSGSSKWGTFVDNTSNTTSSSVTGNNMPHRASIGTEVMQGSGQKRTSNANVQSGSRSSKWGAFVQFDDTYNDDSSSVYSAKTVQNHDNLTLPSEFNSGTSKNSGTKLGESSSSVHSTFPTQKEQNHDNSTSTSASKDENHALSKWNFFTNNMSNKENYDRSGPGGDVLSDTMQTKSINLTCKATNMTETKSNNLASKTTNTMQTKSSNFASKTSNTTATKSVNLAIGKTMRVSEDDMVIGQQPAFSESESRLKVGAVAKTTKTALFTINDLNDGDFDL